LDRFDASPLLFRSRFELAAGDHRSARADLERAFELTNGSYGINVDLALLDVSDGATRRAAQRIQTIPTDSYRVPLEIVLRCAQGDRSSAVTALDRWVEGAKGLSLQYAIVAYVRCGENEKAVALLEWYLSLPLHRISDETVEGLNYYAEFAPLRKIPRYLALLRKLNLPE
jgi:hypothetical protein